MSLLRPALLTFTLFSMDLSGQVAAQTAAPKVTMTRTLDLTPSQSAAEIAVQAGDVVRVHLPTQAGTGYSWRALEVDEEFLAFVGRSVTPPPPPAPGLPARVGGPGPTLTYTYIIKKALRQGSAVLSVPLGFVELPPGQRSGGQVNLLQFNLTDR